MPRYNSFYQIHKGLRHMLYQTASKMQQTDFTNAKEAAYIMEQLNEVIDLFDGHADKEDTFVLPAIVSVEPSAASLFEEEHVQDHALGNRLKSLLNMFHHAISSDEKNEMGSAIRLAFTEFLVFNLNHMAKEENYLNNLLWKYYTDEQLHGITLKIVASIPPERAAKYNGWMMRALSNNEISAWLSMIKKDAPEFVFNNMLALAEKELPGNRWYQVEQSITKQAVPA